MQLNVASGGPAGGQTFEKFDKQVLIAELNNLPTLLQTMVLKHDRIQKFIHHHEDTVLICHLRHGFAR